VEETILADFTRFEGFEGIGDMRMVAINEKLEFTRRELLGEIKVTEKEDIAAALLLLDGPDTCGHN